MPFITSRRRYGKGKTIRIVPLAVEHDGISDKAPPKKANQSGARCEYNLNLLG